MYCIPCLRKLHVLHITYLEHITHEEVLKKAGSTRLKDIVAECRFRLAGHILRLPDHRHFKTATRWNQPEEHVEEVVQRKHGDAHSKKTWDGFI